MAAVARSHPAAAFTRCSCRRVRAMTMVRDEASSRAALYDVRGMLKTSYGVGPERLFPLYARYVPIRDPKNMQSDPRKIHMPSFRWSSPVVPMFGSWTAAWDNAWSATSALL